jgi:small subunit ribosomal protein S4
MPSISCKTCRRLGASVCGREKCAFRRKPYPPGIHGRASRRSNSEYARQLKEKQKLRYMYQIQERQFENYVEKATHQSKGDAGEKLLQSLERRLDNVVYQAGFARMRSTAHQLVSHNHILVNGRKMRIGSYQAVIGDIISLYKRGEDSKAFQDLEIQLKNYTAPAWIALDKEKREAKIVALPDVKEHPSLHDTKLVIEYYAR